MGNDFVKAQRRFLPCDRLDSELSAFEEKRRVLKELDLVVLDNSLRETTVGQLRGHTLENKWQIYNEVRTKVFGISNYTLHDSLKHKKFYWQLLFKRTFNVFC